MENIRVKNTVRNTVWGIINKISVLLMPFFLRTVLIYVMGAEYSGLNSLFTSVLNVLNLAELGVSNAIVYSMYKPIEENDSKTICALMNLFKKVYRIIGVVVIVVGVAITPLIPYLIKGDVPPDINLYIIYYIYLFNTAISYFLFSYKNCLFVAHQRNDVNMKVQTLCYLIQGVAQIMIVVFLKDYYVFLCILPLTTILGNVITAKWADKTYPNYKCGGKISKELKVDLKKQISGLLIGKISGVLRSCLDSLFVSIFLGLIQVAMYNNYFYIVTAVSGFFMLLEPSMSASVGSSLITESVESNYKTFKKLFFVLQWLVSWSSICVLCLIQPFMRIWVGKDLMYSSKMAVLCALYCFVFNIGMVRVVYSQAAGLWWQLRYISVIDIFCNFLLNIGLGYFWGANGILLASILDIVFVSIPWTSYVLFKECFCKEKFWGYILEMIKSFFVALFVSLITVCICIFLPFSNEWVVLIIRVIVCVVVPNMFFWLFYHRKEDYRYMIYYLKNNIVKREKK